MSTTTITVRERAIAAWMEQKERAEKATLEANDADYVEARRQASLRVKGVLAVDVPEDAWLGHPDRVVVEIEEDVTLAFYYTDMPYGARSWEDCWYLRLCVVCPRCGAAVYKGRPIREIEDLGEASAEGQIDRHISGKDDRFDCDGDRSLDRRSRQRLETTEERLVGALVELIRENIPEALA